MLQLCRAVQEVVRICLRNEFPLIWLLHEILISLLFREPDRVLLALETDVCALHEIGGRLPTDQRVLPSVSLFQDIPVHAPVVAMPIAGLGCGLGFLVDAAFVSWDD